MKDNIPDQPISDVASYHSHRTFQTPQFYALEQGIVHVYRTPCGKWEIFKAHTLTSWRGGLFLLVDFLVVAKLFRNSPVNQLQLLPPSRPMLENWPITGQSAAAALGPCSYNTYIIGEVTVHRSPRFTILYVRSRKAITQKTLLSLIIRLYILWSF